MVQRRRMGQILGLLGAFLFLLTVCLPGGAFAGDYRQTLEWKGQGSENAFLGEDCVKGFWHWVLTPGGNNVITEARLSVSYADGGSSVTDGYSNNPQGRGAWHFDVTHEGNEVESAVVKFNYDGEGKENFILTISDSRCLLEGEKDDNDKDDDKDDEDNDHEDGELPETGGLPMAGASIGLISAGILLKKKGK